MEQYGLMGNLSRLRFHAQIPDREAAPNRSQHLSERRTVCGARLVCQTRRYNSVIQ